MTTTARPVNTSSLIASASGWLTTLLVASVTLAPVLVVLFGAIAGNAWHDTIASRLNWNALFYSVVLALRAPLAAFVGFLLAWCLIRLRLPGGRFIEFGLWITFFIPLLPMTLSWILLLSPNSGLLNQLALKLPFVHNPPFNIYSVGGILWVHVIASSIPIMVVLLAPAIRQLDASFEDASRVCGASPLRGFFEITLPILAPAIMTAALAGFIKSLEAFEVEQLIGRPAEIFVYSTRIYDLVSWEPPLFDNAMALSTIVLVFLLGIAIAYRSLSRVKSYATILTRGAGTRKTDIGKWSWLVSALLFLILLTSLFFPLVMLVIGSFMKLFGFFNIPNPFSVQNWLNVLHDPVFIRALWNSLLVSTGAGIGGVLLYSLIAYFIVRSQHPGRHVVEFLAWLPWSIPGILLGISALWLILRVPFLGALYGSLASIILILVVSQMPIGVHMMKTSVLQISPELEQSSRVCGAGVLRTFFAIVLPLIRPMLVSIFLIVFISAMRDISTIIFMASASTMTLSLLMIQYAAASNLEAGAVIGVITTALAVVAALLARHFGLDLATQR